MRNRRAAVQLDLIAMGVMLHLREGVTVTSAKFDPDTETVTFFLEGDCLFKHALKTQTQIIPLAAVAGWGTT